VSRVAPHVRTSGTVPAVPTTVTVTNLKGGTGKTTSAAHIAQSLHELGARVLAVDADPQGSLLRWSEQAGFPWQVIAHPTGSLHRALPGIVGDQWNAVVIDTPPTEDRRAIALSAARAASHVVVPLTPATVEHERMEEVAELLAEAREYDGVAFAAAVLLVKVKRSAASGEVYRAALERAGWRVLRPIVPDWESFRQAWGQPLQRRHIEAYTDPAIELLGEGGAAA
jgi:chromosome partitioning protein